MCAPQQAMLWVPSPPGCLEGSACLSLAALQPAGGASGEKGEAWRPLAGPLFLGLETSLATSPHWELSQPSCLPQPLPDSPLSAASQHKFLTGQPQDSVFGLEE